MGCLDTFPCRSELDEDTRLVDANILVELKKTSVYKKVDAGIGTYLDDVKSLFDRAFDVEREASVDFSRDLSGNNL